MSPPSCVPPTPRTLNDESPLGIRRILSQSTDSLNMRNRTLSVESLIDEGGDPPQKGKKRTRDPPGDTPIMPPPALAGPDVILNQLLSDFETDEKDFEADSWSLAVDNSFLQQHKMDVMKRQDVIYGERGQGTGTKRGSGGGEGGSRVRAPRGWGEVGDVGTRAGDAGCGVARGWGHGDGLEMWGWGHRAGGGDKGKVRDRDRAEAQG